MKILPEHIASQIATCQATDVHGEPNDEAQLLVEEMERSWGEDPRVPLNRAVFHSSATGQVFWVDVIEVSSPEEIQR